MKSIKEKSEEHLNSVYAGYDDVLKKLIKEGYVSMVTAKNACECLRSIMEQLKK